MNRFAETSRRLTQSHAFEIGIIAVILLNAVLLGIATLPAIDRNYGELMGHVYEVTLVVFIAEALLKMYTARPRLAGYFRDGWNAFDFLVIVFALIPATSQFAVIARLARLLRVLRLVSSVKELRLIVGALVRSIPSVGHVLVLMGIIVYVYAIIGYHLFGQHDPENWGNLGLAFLALFKIITLDGWTVLMDTAMGFNGLAWIYFVSFVVLGTFVVANLFIAIIINNLDEAKMERLRELERPVSREELLREIRITQEALRRLETRIGDH